jgi:imidazole glycerol-phosphate synthase subunit HisH
MAPGLINFKLQESSRHFKESVIVIIDYQAGNLTSVVRSLKALGVEGTVTQDPAVVARASRVIFPGVGAAGKAMATLRELGLDQALRQSFQHGIPILGICLGAQVILEHSEENDTACLGLLPGRTRALSRSEGLKIPHMGWNRVRFLKAHRIFKGLPEGAEYYFVHSYYPAPAETTMVVGVTDHGVEFPSAIGWRNLVATQFHPEKSGRFGLQILENFLAWDGSDAE